MALNLALVVMTCLCGAADSASAPAVGQGNWIFLDNGQIRIGIKRSSGAAIGWLSAGGAKRNLINHFDHGRLVQQSYYGQRDGSLWAGKPWRWNPVQGGGYRGESARVLELKADSSRIYARTRPCHWATGKQLDDVTMEEWIRLDGPVAHVRFRFTYRGTRAHPAVDQETPAFFAEPDLETLVVYDGEKPWTGAPVSRSTPGWPNEGRRMTEGWAAYVDDKDFGAGVYVPIASRLTCYRYQEKGSACSYFAPLATFAVKPGLVFEYDLYLAVGTSEQIRQAFRAVRQLRERPRATTPTSRPASLPGL